MRDGGCIDIEFLWCWSQVTVSTKANPKDARGVQSAVRSIARDCVFQTSVWLFEMVMFWFCESDWSSAKRD